MTEVTPAEPMALAKRTDKQLYLEDKIAKASAAIAFAVPGADLSYAKATLSFAQAKLAAIQVAP